MFLKIDKIEDKSTILEFIIMLRLANVAWFCLFNFLEAPFRGCWLKLFMLTVIMYLPSMWFSFYVPAVLCND